MLFDLGGLEPTSHASICNLAMLIRWVGHYMRFYCAALRYSALWSCGNGGKFVKCFVFTIHLASTFRVGGSDGPAQVLLTLIAVCDVVLGRVSVLFLCMY